jgi:hypothetical protein
MSKPISISDELKNELDDQRDKEGHTSHDSLIRLMRAESEMYRLIKADYETLKNKLDECEKRKKKEGEEPQTEKMQRLKRKWCK